MDGTKKVIAVVMSAMLVIGDKHKTYVRISARQHTRNEE